MNKFLIRVFYNEEYGWWFKSNWRKPSFFNIKYKFIKFSNYKIL